MNRVHEIVLLAFITAMFALGFADGMDYLAINIEDSIQRHGSFTARGIVYYATRSAN